MCMHKKGTSKLILSNIIKKKTNIYIAKKRPNLFPLCFGFFCSYCSCLQQLTLASVRPFCWMDIVNCPLNTGKLQKHLKKINLLVNSCIFAVSIRIANTQFRWESVIANITFVWKSLPVAVQDSKNLMFLVLNYGTDDSKHSDNSSNRCHNCCRDSSSDTVSSYNRSASGWSKI